MIAGLALMTDTVLPSMVYSNRLEKAAKETGWIHL